MPNNNNTKIYFLDENGVLLENIELLNTSVMETLQLLDGISHVRVGQQRLKAGFTGNICVDFCEDEIEVEVLVEEEDD